MVVGESEEGHKKAPAPYSFSPVTSPNIEVGGSPKN